MGKQFEEFSKNYQVIRIDLAGSGKSSPHDNDFSLLDDIKGLVQFLDIEKVHLIGLSVGGNISMDFANTFPEMVDKLILVSTGLLGWTDFSNERKQYMEDMKVCEGLEDTIHLMCKGSGKPGQDLINTELISLPTLGTNDGTPLVAADGPNWHIWDAGTGTDTLKNDRYYGYYIQDETQRIPSAYPKGPAFISGENIFLLLKDTDLNYFEGGVGLRANLGYPLRLQVEQMIYSWGYGDYKDFIFMKYVITNKSSDTLHNCWSAVVMDADIGRKPSVNQSNDRCKYFDWDTTLNLCIQWTDASTAASGEKGDGFGFLGFNFLESPAVDANFNLRHDKKVYSDSEQSGLKTFKDWNIEEDLSADDARYNVLASLVRDGDNGPVINGL